MNGASSHSRWATRALPLVPALAIAQYWIASLVRGESFSVAATYRHGDFNYFPHLAGLAQFNLGESLVFEHLGEGFRSFPLPSLLLHGGSIGLFGNAGWILADVVVAVCVFFAARRFFRACGLSDLTTSILTLVVSCGLVGWPANQFEQWLGWAPTMQLWGFRFPRPLLTDLFLLLCVGSGLRILAHGRRSAGEWALLGLWFSLLLQSRLYSAATVGLAIGFGALYLVFRGDDYRGGLRGLAVFAGTTALTAIPFVIQRLLEHPDIPARFGVFPVDRLSPLWVDERLHDLVAGATFGAAVALLVRLRAIPHWRLRVDATLLLTLLFLLSGFALPASTLLLGRTVQPYHFRAEVMTFKALVILVGVGQLCDIAIGLLRRRLRVGDRTRTRIAAALVVTVAAGCLAGAWSRHRSALELQTHWRTDFPAYNVPDYRAAFRELTHELTSDRYADARVLATLDIQVLDWWSLFGGGNVFSPDPCATNLSDDEIEMRLLTLFRTLGASERDMQRLIHARGVMIFFLGCAKYQASSAYSFSPLESYPRRIRARAKRSSPLNSWLIALPDSEAQRLGERYARTTEVGAEPRLDLIVLGPGHLDAHLAPSSEQFELTFKNARFRVYARRQS